MNATALADALNDALPQTQCTRCGFPDCRSYAHAMVEDAAPINRCPPGGQEGVLRLARITGRAIQPLDPDHGIEAPRQRAVIDEAWCIGCTLCLDACPVDCIVGAPKLMHTVVAAQCTGCELCLPACPVDCIALLPASGARTGWQAWSAAQAQEARARYGFHQDRLRRATHERAQQIAGSDGQVPVPERKASVVAEALARARAARAS